MNYVILQVNTFFCFICGSFHFDFVFVNVNLTHVSKEQLSEFVANAKNKSLFNKQSSIAYFFNNQFFSQTLGATSLVVFKFSLNTWNNVIIGSVFQPFIPILNESNLNFTKCLAKYKIENNKLSLKALWFFYLYAFLSHSNPNRNNRKHLISKKIKDRNWNERR